MVKKQYIYIPSTIILFPSETTLQKWKVIYFYIKLWKSNSVINII